MITLLEKAKQFKTKSTYVITPEVIELALAWTKDEVTITQLQRSLNIKQHNKIYSILSRALKANYKNERANRNR